MIRKEVFKFALNVNVETINTLLSENNLTIDDIKYIIPHQANERILNSVATKLKCEQDKLFMNLDKYGNTSSASIPICIDEMNKNGLLCTGDNIILVGFGGGLTYGGALIKWKQN